MNGLHENLQELFQDEDARYAYAEAYLNASIAAQIKEYRGDMNQEELAAKVGTKQPGISRLENANYSAWKVETLRKLARAFGLRLRITFEEFGTLIPEIHDFDQNILRRRKFERDPVFNPGIEDVDKVPANSSHANSTASIPELFITIGNVRHRAKECECSWCKKKFLIRLAQLKSRPGRDGKFCSHSCCLSDTLSRRWA